MTLPDQWPTQVVLVDVHSCPDKAGVVVCFDGPRAGSLTLGLSEAMTLADDLTLAVEEARRT